MFDSGVTTEIYKVIGYIIAGFVSILSIKAFDVFSKWKKKITTTYSLEHDVKISNILSEIRVLFGSGRVKLFQFRNGSYYFGGNSEQKLVLTHFVSNIGIAPPMLRPNSIYEIPCGFIVNQLQSIVSGPSLLITDELSDDCVLKCNFTVTGTASVIAFCISNYRKEPIGVLMVSWVDKNDKVFLLQKLSFLQNEINKNLILLAQLLIKG